MEFDTKFEPKLTIKRYEIWIQNQYTPPGFKINPSDIVVDIGSHIGVFAGFASKYAYNGKVYSFEPIPKNFELLNENISLNNLKNLVPFNKAVTNKKGRVKMRVYEAILVVIL